MRPFGFFKVRKNTSNIYKIDKVSKSLKIINKNY